MSGFVVCAVCGARIRSNRPRCLRCDAPLQAARVDTEGGRFPLSKGQLLIGGVAASLIALVIVVTMSERQPADKSAASVAPGSGSGAARAGQPPSQTGVARAVDAPEPVTAQDAARSGRTSLAAGDLPAAKARYTEALEKNPDDAEALNGLGLVLEREGQFADAHDRFARAAQLGPNNWSYRFNLAHAAAALQQWDEAIGEYREAARLFPTDYATEFNLAMALHKKGDDQLAIPEFQKAVQLGPSEASFHVALAVSLEKIGNVADARREYQRYLDMEPSAADAAKVKEHIAALAAQSVTTPPPPKPAPSS